jgi:hypothetical protein
MLTLYLCIAEEETSTRLHALRWRVAGLLAKDKIEHARNAGSFYPKAGKGAPKPFKLDSTLADVKGNDSAVALKLVIA